jgi:hypothetical protein
MMIRNSLSYVNVFIFLTKSDVFGKDDKDHVPPSHDIEMILEA